MDESDKLPLKRVELSLTKFNEVAIPHHLDLLRQHKANIIKYEGAGEYGRVRTEQSAAARTAARLRELLSELEALRRSVRADDVPRFDRLTQRVRDTTLRAVTDYREWTAKAAIPDQVAGSITSQDSVGLVPLGDFQLLQDEQEAREEALRGWSALQTELQALHEAWQHVQAAALAQAADVRHVAECADVAADNVQVARLHLSAAEKLRGAAWAVGGACCGALAGGPVGLAVGAKAGAVAALAGSVLGYVTARVLGRRPLPAADDPPARDKDA